jgi:hypothetical protein
MSTKDNMSTISTIWDIMFATMTTWVSHNAAPKLDAFIQNYKNIKNKETHYQLKADLIEHLWQNHSELYNID